MRLVSQTLQLSKWNCHHIAAHTCYIKAVHKYHSMHRQWANAGRDLSQSAQTSGLPCILKLSAVSAKTQLCQVSGLAPVWDQRCILNSVVACAGREALHGRGYQVSSVSVCVCVCVCVFRVDEAWARGPFDLMRLNVRKGQVLVCQSITAPASCCAWPSYLVAQVCKWTAPTQPPLHIMVGLGPLHSQGQATASMCPHLGSSKCTRVLMASPQPSCPAHGLRAHHPHGSVQCELES